MFSGGGQCICLFQLVAFLIKVKKEITMFGILRMLENRERVTKGDSLMSWGNS